MVLSWMSNMGATQRGGMLWYHTLTSITTGRSVEGEAVMS